MNKVSIEGRLTKDPELEATRKKPVCDMRIAVNGEGNIPTCFIDVAAFGELAADSAELAKVLGDVPGWTVPALTTSPRGLTLVAT